MSLNNLKVYKNPDNNWKQVEINGRMVDIPCDWEIEKFESYFKSRMGETILQNNLIKNGTIPVYSATEKNEIFGYINGSKINLNKNDLVIPARGNSIGYIKIINGLATGTQTTICAKSKNNNKYETKYIYEYLMYLKKKKHIFKIEGGAIPQLTVKEMNLFEIITPSTLLEQTNIAEILTTQEDLIASKKELLSLTKKQKQYLNQELLSGRLRIRLTQESIDYCLNNGLIVPNVYSGEKPYGSSEEIKYGVGYEIVESKNSDFETWLNDGESGKVEFYLNSVNNWKQVEINGRMVDIPCDWEIEKFESYFKSRMGETILQNNLIKNGTIPVYSATEKNEIFGYINGSKINLNKNDLVIPARGNSIGYIKIINGLATGTQTTICAKSKNNNKYETKYIYEYLMYLKKKKHIFKIEGGAIPQLTVKEMNLFEIITPSTLLEQTLIANQLTQMDNTVEQLEKEIEIEEQKFTFLKQELLSGSNRIK